MKDTLQAVVILGYIVTLVGGQAGCDYRQNLQPGRSYDVFSPGFPNSYRGAHNCRWTAVAPTGMVPHIHCSNMNLPTSRNCVNDQLLISVDGRANFAGAAVFCGNTPFTNEARGRTLVVGFRTPRTSLGGRFLCSITSRPCQCGQRRSTRIVGGTEAAVHEFPMMAGLVDSRTRIVTCGATIISHTHAVTAAHCTRTLPANRAGLLVGEHDLSTGIETSHTRLLTVARFIVHGGFVNNPSRNDIALVQPSTNIIFSPGVAPVCLPFDQSTNTFLGALVVATGWGTLDFGGPTSNRLMRVTLNVVANSICTSRLNNPNILASHLCTFTPGRDTCQQDSGGPLMWNNPRNNRLYLAGIASFGIECGTHPSANTRLTSFLTWIQQNTPGIDYCRPA